MADSQRPTKIRKIHNDDAAGQAAALQAMAEVSANASSSESTETPANTIAPDAASSSSPSRDRHDRVALKTPIVDPETGQPVSKNQQKKLRRRLEWDAGRDFRRAKRKEKVSQKRARKRDQKAHQAKELKAQGLTAEQIRQKQNPRAVRPVRLPITFVIDCGYDDKMLEKERISLGSQLTRAYSDNYKAHIQGHLVVSSWKGELKNRFDTVLSKHYENWRDVVFTENDFLRAAEQAELVMKGPNGGRMEGVFAKFASVSTTAATSPLPENADDILCVDTPVNGQNLTAVKNNLESLKSESEIVYLTSDSPYTLSTLKPYSTYIIGGLVDKNRHKGICYKAALDMGFDSPAHPHMRTAKLPIGQFMEMQSRFVLATNHVAEIMVRYLECGDWGEAFMKVIPKRKGGHLRDVEADSVSQPESATGLEEGGDNDDRRDPTLDDDEGGRHSTDEQQRFQGKKEAKDDKHDELSTTDT